MSSDYLQVATATVSKESAISLARSAVENGFAAGAQIAGPVASIVWHHGDVVEGDEWLVVLVTTSDRYAALEQHLIREHPWTNPQVTATQVVRGSPAYLNWVSRTTTAS
jgi:periplasmic divalent cation tolerance protein